jgi:hypothetical protein
MYCYCISDIESVLGLGTVDPGGLFWPYDVEISVITSIRSGGAEGITESGNEHTFVYRIRKTPGLLAKYCSSSGRVMNASITFSFMTAPAAALAP